MTEGTEKLRVFSGIQPTGRLHLGNYLGALSLWAELQGRHDCIFCIADLHALTVPEGVSPGQLRRNVVETAALVIACGIDPRRSAFFVQSRVPAHAELAWLLNCVTPVAWLERMTQYKSKATRATSVSTALLAYPVLQAADILLYDTHRVPVGEDQKQHVELTRDIAQRFHSLFGAVFVMPEAMIQKGRARIMGLDDPTVKMSKSVGETKPGHAIGLTDPPEVIRDSIMRAVTDAGSEVRLDDASSGVKNLLTIYEALSGRTRAEVQTHVAGQGYAAFKREVADVVIETLRPIREHYRRLMNDTSHLSQALSQCVDRVRPIADATLDRAKRALGLSCTMSGTGAETGGGQER